MAATWPSPFGVDGKVRLHTRRLNESRVTPLTGTENAHSPFFSPAGDWIGFFADGKLKKVAAEGGAVVTLCDASTGYGGSWGDDGSIIAALNYSSFLSRVPSSGGEPMPVTKFNSADATHRWPQVLPGSKAVLFTAAAQAGTGYDDANIEAVSLETGEAEDSCARLFRSLSQRCHPSEPDRIPHLSSPEYAFRRALSRWPFSPRWIPRADSGGCRQQRVGGRAWCVRPRRNVGHDVETVLEEELGGASDETLFEVCVREGRCLLTLDIDSADVLRFPPHQTAGIAVLRLPKNPSLRLLETLAGHMLQYLASETIHGRLWIVEPGRVRVMTILILR